MKSLIKAVPESFRDRYRSRWQQATLELKTSWGKTQRQFLRPKLPNVEDKKINLHLGCGAIHHPQFINIDGLPYPHIHYIRAIDNLSPFNGNTVDLIYACHCLEHFSHTYVSEVLAEWYRVLKPKGILRLSVPDFDLMLKVYENSNKDINSILMQLMGGQDYKFNFHMTAFTQKSLSSLLKDVGFRFTQEWRPGSSELTTFNDYSMAKILLNGEEYCISLNLEAVK